MMKKISLVFLIFILISSACSSATNLQQADLEIHDIQGCSHVSPYDGKMVSNLIGVVTHKNNNGFTMQSIVSDDKQCSSEGIYVFTKNYPDVLTGNLVSVDGSVEEFTEGSSEDHNLSQTEIVMTAIKVIQSEYSLPNPVILGDLLNLIPMKIIENDQMTKFDPNEDGLDFYESLESMLVEIKNGIVVAPKNTFREIVVLPVSFSDENLVSVQGAVLNTIDDSNPEKIMIKLPSNFDEKVNIGDRFANPIIGVMDYSYGNYKVLAFPPLEITQSNQEDELFLSKSDGLTLATYNLENLSPMDGNKKFETLSSQIVNNLISPDLLLLNEVMDNSGSIDDGVVQADRTIQKLVNAIQKAGGPSYSYSDTPPNNNQDGGIGGGNIRSVLLYREDKGIHLEREISNINKIKIVKGLFQIEQNPLLVGEFSQAFSGSRKPRIWLLNQDGKQFFVVGVHLVSQSANYPDWGNQQPPDKPEEPKRVNQTALINQQLNQIYELNPEIPIFIAGDMNDLPWSDSIKTISGTNFMSITDAETPEENYSYIFEGNAQQLDYILINKNLAHNVIQARFVHLNSFLDQEDAVSDHDPLIIEFRFNQ